MIKLRSPYLSVYGTAESSLPNFWMYLGAASVGSFAGRAFIEKSRVTLTVAVPILKPQAALSGACLEFVNAG